MIADTRTNAGLDNISTFRKLHVYTQPGERIMALASSGNLSLSQTVRSILTEGVDNPETGERETLMNAPTMFQAAQRIGRAIRGIQSAEGKALEAADVDHRGRLPVRRPDQGRAPAAVHDLLSREFHRMHRPTRRICRSASINTASRCSTAPSASIPTFMTRSRSGWFRWIPPCAPTWASACRSICWWCAAIPAQPKLTIASSRASPISRTCAKRWSSALRAAHMDIPRPPYGRPDLRVAPAAGPFYPRLTALNDLGRLSRPCVQKRQNASEKQAFRP